MQKCSFFVPYRQRMSMMLVASQRSNFGRPLHFSLKSLLSKISLQFAAARRSNFYLSRLRKTMRSHRRFPLHRACSVPYRICHRRPRRVLRCAGGTSCSPRGSGRSGLALLGWQPDPIFEKKNRRTCISHEWYFSSGSAVTEDPSAHVLQRCQPHITLN